MNAFVIPAAFVIAAFAFLSAIVGKRSSLFVTVLGWLIFVGGCIAIYFDGLTFAGGWLAVAGTAGFGVGLATTHEGTKKRLMAAVGVTMASVASALIFLDPSAASVTGTHALLVTAVWASVIASVTGALTAALIPSSGRTTGVSVGLAAGAGFLGAALVGSSRTSVGELGYYIGLEGPEGPLFWTLPGMERMPEGLRLSATVALPSWVFWACIAGALALVVAAILYRLKDLSKVFVSVAAVAAVTSGVLIAGITGSNTTKLPEATPYEDYARSALLARQAPEEFLAEGGFSQDQVAGVWEAPLGADVGFLVFAALAALLVVFFHLRRDEFDHDFSGLARRDLLVRSLGLGWLAWFITLLLKSVYLGAAGVGAPGEWFLLGHLLTATGLLFIAWRADNRFSAALSEVLAGLIVFGWIGWVALSLAFGSIPGLGLSFF